MTGLRIGNGKRQAFHWAVLVLVVLAAGELLGLVGLAALSKLRGLKYDPISEERLPAMARERIAALVAGRTAYVAHSPTLGWTLKPRGVAFPYRASAQGLRADRDYALVPPPGILRIAAFGDSFTHADDVTNEEAWTRQLEALDPRLEVLNFGVLGYAPDQALLRYQEDGERFQPKLVLLGVMPENVFRIVNVFRPFYSSRSELPLAKPRFLLEGDRLLLLPNPLPRLADYEALLREPSAWLPRLGAHDYFFRIRARPGPFEFYAPVRIARLIAQERRKAPADQVFRDGCYNADSEAFRLLVRLIAEFRRVALAQGALPLVVIFPDRSDLARYREARTRRYEPLRAQLARSPEPWLDLLDVFGPPSAGSVDELARGHYTPRGNALVAGALHAWLADRGLLDGAGLRRARSR